MYMKFSPTPIADLWIIEPTVFPDDRGFFYESFKQSAFDAVVGNDPATGQPYAFVQDNHSVSCAGAVRGLHFQRAPFAQGKLVRVVAGAVWDVTVDIRQGSATFGQWFGLELSAENKKELWIPPGFAHGFMTVSDEAAFVYKTTAPYHKASEGAVRWDDAQLNIAWPQAFAAKVSEKDALAPSFAAAVLF
jgi:dTDP-4-dehydrorhamnose 3,5-epimerase